MITAARRRQDRCRCCAGSTPRSSSTCRASSTTSTSAFLDASDIDRRDRDLRLDDHPQHHRDGRHVPLDRLPGVQGALPRESRGQHRRHRRRRSSIARSVGSPSTRSCPTARSSSASNNEGVPFVLAEPDARGQPGHRAGRGRRCSGWPRCRSAPVGARRGPVSDPRPIGVFDSGVGGLTVLREIVRRSPARIDDLPRRQRAGALRRAPRRGGAGVLDPVPRRPRGARRQGARRRLQHLDRGRARVVPAALRPAGPRRHPARGVGSGAGDAEPARRRHRHAGHDPVARLLRGDQGREPGRRGLRARHAGARAARRSGRAGRVDGRGHGRRRPGTAPGRTRRGRRVDLPAAARRVDRHAAPGLHPLSAPARRSSPSDRRRPRGDRRFGHGDRFGPGRAPERQRPRGVRHHARRRRCGAAGHDRPTELSARRSMSSSRPATPTASPHSPVACSAPAFPDGRAASISGRWRDERAAAPRRRVPRGATIARGRPASSSDRRSGAAATVVGRRMERTARDAASSTGPTVERLAIERGWRAPPGR